MQNSTISDKKFDSLILILKKLEKKNKNLINSHSPTQRIGSNLLQFLKSKKHITPMLSVQNIFKFKDLVKFEKKMKDKLSIKKNIKFCCELKLDGLAISILYKKGVFIQAITRGDGIHGENVTKNARTIINLPLKLKNNKVPKMLEVRGEVVILKKDFITLNKNLFIQKKKLFSNARNAASGSLRKKPSRDNQRKLMFFAYSCNLFHFEKKYNSQFNRLKKLKNWGFSVNKNFVLLNDIYQIYKFYNTIFRKKNNLNVEIDGIVIKIDNIKHQKKIGNTATYPRWSVAFKFISKKYITQILSISFQVGRTGTITPVAYFTPVNIEGTIITKASLHNKHEMIKLNVSEGDFVEIKKAGEVIPKITKVIYKSNQASKKIYFPEFCPSCFSAIVENKNKKISKCTGTLICSSQKQKKLEHFVSKSGLNIIGLGPSIIKKLVKNRLISNVSDFFSLKKENLYTIHGIQKKSAKNIICAINKSKEISLEKFINSLGISQTGMSTSVNISSFFTSLKSIKNASIKDFLKIKNIGKKTAENIFSFFKTNKSLILNLEKNLKIKNSFVNLKKPVCKFFKNKNIVFTGSFSGISRQQAIEKVLLLGCNNVNNHVSKKTNLLICGINCGEKAKKAKLLKIKILKEKIFLLICKKYLDLK